MTTKLTVGRLIYEEEEDSVEGRTTARLSFRWPTLATSAWIVSSALQAAYVAYVFYVTNLRGDRISLSVGMESSTAFAFLEVTLLQACVRERGAKLSRSCPRLERGAIVERTASAKSTYRSAPATRSFVFDGAPRSADNLLGITVCRRSRPKAGYVYSIVAVFENGAIELLSFPGRLYPPQRPAETPDMLRRLAALMETSVYDNISTSDERKGIGLFVSLLMLTIFGWTITFLLACKLGPGGEQAGMIYAYLLLVPLASNFVAFFYGGRYYARARDSIFQELKHEIRVRTSGKNPEDDDEPATASIP